MKKQIFSLMALLVFTSPCLGQNPKIVEFPNIYLNTNTINQRTITYKNEKSGAKDLQTIASLEDYEQGWVFIQNYKKTDSSQWINITKRMYANGEGFEIDTMQLEEIMRENNKLIDYHFHKRTNIDSTISNEAKKELKKYGKFDSSITYDFLLNEILENNLAENAMPSIQDIAYMVDNTIKYSQINSKGKISFKICSKLGVCEYKLTPKGIRFFKKIGRKNLLSLEGKDKSPFIKKYDKNIKDIETAKNFASQVSSDLLTVNFKSWEEFYSSQ